MDISLQCILERCVVASLVLHYVNVPLSWCWQIPLVSMDVAQQEQSCGYLSFQSAGRASRGHLGLQHCRGKYGCPSVHCVCLRGGVWGKTFWWQFWSFSCLLVMSMKALSWPAGKGFPTNINPNKANKWRVQNGFADTSMALEQYLLLSKAWDK